MSFNIDKCKVMHLGRTNKAYVYCLDDVPLVEVTEEKDLGIIISKDLKVSKQCASAYSKAIVEHWVSSIEQLCRPTNLPKLGYTAL